ncbi:MAG: glycosyltransferase family 2 protein [Chloroflexota bacterium]
MKQAAPLLAVVLVTYNVRVLALDALRSLYADLELSSLAADVYVVDSGSTDATAAAIAAGFPQVRLTRAENLGFGRANNLAIRQMISEPHPPDAIYLLNPDTITQPGATKTLYEALQADPRIGLVGAGLRYGDGSFQHSAFAFPGLRQLWVELFPTPGRLIEAEFNGRYPRELYQRGKPFPVDFVLGATMMLRREVIEKTGGFDEQFFMYCEEIDWARRIHDAGYGVYCVPAAQVIHLAGQSTVQERPRSLINLWTSRLRLLDKYAPAWKRLLARGMIALGIALKARAADDPALREACQTVCKRALGHRKA